MNREQKAIIAIASLKNVMGIFLGPFLTAYFLKTTEDSLILISFYYIITFLVLALGTLIVARIVNNRFRIQMYRIGVITTFIYMLSIVFLQEKIVYFLPLIAILNGTALATYWYPYNLFVTNKIDNKDRVKFTVTANTVSSIVGVVTPIVLGTIITSSNFKLTSIIITILAGIIILLSFVLKTEKNYDLSMLNKYDEDLNSSLSFISEFDLENEENDNSFNSSFDDNSVEVIEITSKIKSEKKII